MCSLCPVLISIHFDDFTGAYHSTKNFEIFETGTNGDKTVEFPKSEPFNRKFREFRQESQMERKFPAKIFRKYGYTSRSGPLFFNLCKFPIFYVYSALATLFGRDHGELDISRKDDGDAHSIKETL